MKFPVIFISNDHTYLEVIHDKELLTVTNALSLKKGLILQNYIVDSDGTLFDIVGAKKRENINSNWKFEFFNPMIKVILSTQSKGKEELNELKLIVESVLKSDIEFWDADGELESRINLVKGARSFEQLINRAGQETDRLNL